MQKCMEGVHQGVSYKGALTINSLLKSLFLKNNYFAGIAGGVCARRWRCVFWGVVNVPARQRQNGPCALGSRRLRLDRLFRFFLVRWIVCLDPRTYSLHLRLQRSHTSHAYAAFPRKLTNTSIEHKREISNHKPDCSSQRETIREPEGGEVKERALRGKYM